MAVAHMKDADLYYEVHGTGETLFLTHGSWGDATGWRAVIPGLAERYEVVIWDRRGHSRSSGGERSGTIDDDATDLAELIQHLDRPGAHVYGSSSGGTVVLKLLAARPDLVSSVVVHEPAVPGLLDSLEDTETRTLLEEMNDSLDRVRAMIESDQHAAAAEYFIDNVAIGPGAWDRLPQEVRRAFTANAPTYAEELCDPTAFVVDTDTIAAADIPLLITHGTESPPLLLAATHKLIDGLPGARVVTLENSGHVPYRTDPDLWLQTYVGFLQTVSASRTGIAS